MAKQRRRPHRPHTSGGVAPRAAWSVLRPAAWSALLGAAFATALAAPAYAAPPPAYVEPGRPGQVPDGGTRPVPAGPLTLPGQSTATQPTGPAGPAAPAPVTGGQVGPFAQQLSAAETDVASRAEALKKLRLERAGLRAELVVDERAWRTAQQEAQAAERIAQEAAGAAYREAAALPPGAAGSDLHDLSQLSRLRRQQSASSTAAGREAVRAREAEQAASREYKDVLARLAAVERQYAIQEPAYRAKVAALRQLRQRNAAALAEAERQREARERQLGAQYLPGGGTGTATGGTGGPHHGLRAHPKAEQAVRFAMAQRGEPYEWGAEGPHSWDCSGLMWGAYRSVGIEIPRVAADQYHGTRGRLVDRRALLPGDLVFFASNPADWRSIHHVGMYIGNGLMVHAPTTGDVVRVATVWWSRFYAATRVVGACTIRPLPMYMPTWW
ncbi:MAG TPA: NlpC/P60 family protein, partial [Pilimelia sp.]|nr:NlpC/P60 family protein [Pilimelia sp.]